MKITDTVTPTDYTVLTTAEENDVYLRVVDSGRRGRNALAQLPRAEFIRAIETELDVTVINGSLPSVRVDQSGTTSSLIADTFSGRSIARYVTEDPTRRRATALAEEAIARHLEANPPVDPQVKVLADILGDFAIADEHTGERDDLTLAKRLVERGVRAPEAGENQ